MATMELRIHQGIHILSLTNADNQCDNMLTTSVLEEYLTALDTVENHHHQTALVITCDHDKTFCTGINLEWLRSQTDT
jgi:enoyl-CoA hydratase/carnithine racemase